MELTRKWYWVLYINGNKYERDFKWSISYGEIHCDYGSGEINIIRINQDKALL